MENQPVDHIQQEALSMGLARLREWLARRALLAVFETLQRVHVASPARA
jgi:hypothetical protein